MTMLKNSGPVRRWGLVILGSLLFSMAAIAEETTIRIGLTAVFLDNKTSFLRQWEKYLEGKSRRPVEFIQRQSYREITDLLMKERIDAAWICGYPFVKYKDELRLLAVPLYKGKPLYQSYMIVPVSDTTTKGIEDLQGAVFAYSDPDSNSGFLVPQVDLLKKGIDPKHFFSKTFFTWSHRDVVVAVAEGLANGGAVDGYVWDTLAQTHPELTKRTRIVSRSEWFGFPPFASRTGLSGASFRLIQDILINMKNDPVGAALLKKLNIDGFTRGDAALFDGIADEIGILDARR